MEIIPKFNKCRASFKAVGAGKNTNLLNAGPTFISDYTQSVLIRNAAKSH